MALQLGDDSWEELVGDVEDDDVCALDGVEQVWISHQILWQLDVWQVLDVLVLCVDDVGEVLAANGLLEDPHVDSCGKEILVDGRVLGDDLGDGGAPVTRADDGDLEGVNEHLDVEVGGVPLDWGQGRLHDVGGLVQSISSRHGGGRLGGAQK